jgi:hypothetical protein
VKVICDETNNTSETIARGELHVNFMPETVADILTLMGVNGVASVALMQELGRRLRESAPKK